MVKERKDETVEFAIYLAIFRLYLVPEEGVEPSRRSNPATDFKCIFFCGFVGPSH